MKGTYKTPPDSKEPLDYSYIAGNGKVLNFSESKFVVKSIQRSISCSDIFYFSCLLTLLQDYAIRKIHGKQEEMEVNGVNKFIFCAHGINLLGDNCREKHRNSITFC